MAAEEGFEASLEKLEALVARLESGDLPLEEAMKQFETGMHLSGRLAQRLETTQRRVEQLVQDKDGNAKLAPFGDADQESGQSDHTAAAEDEDESSEGKASPTKKAKTRRGRPQDSLF
jgi:exodeoxyribonuclease VII small subunit